MPIDPRMVKWDEAPKIDSRMVAWEADAPQEFAQTPQEILRAMPWGQRQLVGAGATVQNLWEGIKQFAGKADPKEIELARIAEREAPIGAFAGNAMTAAVPFGMAGSGIKAAGLVGAGLGALQPVEGEQTPANIAQGKALNTAIGGAAGAGGQWVANKASNYIGNKLTQLAAKKAQDAELNATLQAGIDAGYAAPPSMMPTSGVFPRLMEGLSGKYKTNQAFGIHNQRITDTMSRRAVGLADDAPLTEEAMQAIRRRAYQAGYEPVERFGQIKVDSKFLDDLNGIVASRNRASNAFPGAIKDDVGPFIDSLKQAEGFHAGDALKAVQIFRNQANDAYRLGNTDLGAAKKQAAKAIEDQIERTLQVKADAKDAWQAIDEVLGRRMSDADFGVMKQARAIAGNLKTGKLTQEEALSRLTQLTPKSKTANDALMVAHDMIANAANEQAYAQQLLSGFRDARTLMAKAHTVEDAIRTGGGHVDAKAFARRVQAGKPMSGELKTIGEFANNFGDVMGIPKSGNANPFTALDFMQGGISTPLGVLAGGAPGALAALALPSARVAARYGLLSAPVQRMISTPSYTLGLPARVGGGLLQYAPVGTTALGLQTLGQ